MSWLLSHFLALFVILLDLFFFFFYLLFSLFPIFCSCLSAFPFFGVLFLFLYLSSFFSLSFFILDEFCFPFLLLRRLSHFYLSFLSHILYPDVFSPSSFWGPFPILYSSFFSHSLSEFCFPFSTLGLLSLDALSGPFLILYLLLLLFFLPILFPRCVLFPILHPGHLLPM